MVLTALFTCKYYCRANDENDDTKVKMQQANKNYAFKFFLIIDIIENQCRKNIKIALGEELVQSFLVKYLLENEKKYQD